MKFDKIEFITKIEWLALLSAFDISFCVLANYFNLNLIFKNGFVFFYVLVYIYNSNLFALSIDQGINISFEE
jgi:hypothetical protein